MGYEVDFIPVGEGEKSGDAIAIRFGNLNGPRSEQTVITIDGGTADSGDLLVGHILNHYKTDTVDIALLTHPDNDHASGMRNVIEKLKVRQIVMHLPWNHSMSVKALIDDTRVSHNSLRERTKKNLKAAKDIFDLASQKGIAIVEPFAGTGSENIKVLGPTREFYQTMLANFDFMPGTDSNVLDPLSTMFKKLGEAVAGWLPENWLTEHLKEPAIDATSEENNSSVILLLQIEGRKILFCGDAGVPALTAAANYADANQISLSGINLLQVPHHGSRHNVGPTILNRIFGDIRQTDAKDWAACVSAGKEGAPKHPHKKVINALRRRGAAVLATAGRQILYAFNAPQRSGWNSLEPLPFYHQVEDDD